MFNKRLFPTRSQEFLDEARIPKFTGDSEILAAAHQGVGLAAFCGGWNAVGVKVLLLAAGDRNQSAQCQRLSHEV